MTETIDKAEFLRLARAAGFYHYDMPDVEGQDLGQSLESDGRGAVDRLVASLQAHITDRLAAAEARNATLTDDAARWRWLRRCKGQEHDPLFTVQHEIDGTLWGGDLDAAIDAARAAASISTKEGDNHAD